MIRYRLGDAQAAHRARASVMVRAVTSMAPVVLAVVLLNKLGWQPAVAFWAVAAALGGLVVARAVVGYVAIRRQLRTLVVVVDDDDIRVEAAREAFGIHRTRVARIVDVEGALGGLRVESQPDPLSGVVSVVRVPRGGEAFGELRAILERWRPLERRGRRSPALRVALGSMVVVAIFFVPFLLEDLVGRSKVVAAAMVFTMWLGLRAVMRKG